MHFRVFFGLFVCSICACSALAQRVPRRFPVFPQSSLATTSDSLADDLPFVLAPLAGDFNGDGVPDLFLARRHSNTIGVFESIGRGTWADSRSVATLPEDVQLQDAVARDVNSDGHTDLAFWVTTPNLSEVRIGVLLADGAGGFVVSGDASAIVPSLRRPGFEFFQTIVVADITGDGHNDILVAASALVLFESDGRGGFQPGRCVDFSVLAVEAVDIDGDGTSEVLHVGSDGVEVSQVDSDGAWIRAASIPLLGSTSGAVALAVTPRPDGEPGVRVYACSSLSARSGDIGPDFSSSAGPIGDAGRRGVAVADVLGGAAPDLVFGDGTILIDPGVENIGTRVNVLSIAPGGNFVATAFVEDVDLDGNPEALIADTTGIRILRTTGVGTEREFETNPVFPAEGARVEMPGIGIGDFDGDGLRDVVMTSSNDSASHVFYQEADASFSYALLPFTTPSARAHVADVDADGLDDVLLSSSGSVVRILYAEPGRSFTPPLATSVAARPLAIRTGDIDGDGALDIVSQSRNGFSVLRSEGPRNFVFSYNESNVNASLGLAVGDANGDGFDDVAYGGVMTPRVFIAFSNGDGTFSPSFALGLDEDIEAMDFADLDRDGDMDLIVFCGPSYPNSVVVYENAGHGAFSRNQQIGFDCGNSASGSEYGSIADFDADGYPDIIAACNDGVVHVFRSDGNAGIVPFSEVATIAEGLNQIAVGDLDGDGFPDAVVPVPTDRFGADPGFIALYNAANSPNGCPADLAPPRDTLDLADITAFVTGFTGTGDEADADLAAPFGVLDLADIAAFVTVFVDGCD